MREAIRISIELLVLAVVVYVVATFGMVSRMGINSIDRYNTSKQFMQDHLELFEYNNKSVHGVDVVDALLKYARIYQFEVRIPTSVVNTYAVYRFNSQAEIDTGRGRELWSKSYIDQVILPEYLKQNFKSELIYDTSKSSILGVRFTLEG